MIDATMISLFMILLKIYQHGALDREQPKEEKF